MFEEMNAPLHEKMVQAGNRLVERKGYRHYVDSTGIYVPYPVGYITGVGYSPSNGTPTPYYASVQGPNGWVQRYFKTSNEAEQWAIETAKSIRAMS